MTYHQAKAILEARKSYLESRISAVDGLIRRVEAIDADADMRTAVSELRSAYLDFLTAMQAELRSNHKSVTDEQVALERAAMRSIIVPGVQQ